MNNSTHLSSIPLVKLIAVSLTTLMFSTPVFSTASSSGKIIYDGKGACVACHGTTGNGDGVAAAALNPKPTSFTQGIFRLDTDADGATGTDSDLINAIKNGAATYGGNAAMPARADLSEAEINDLIAYIRSLKK